MKSWLVAKLETSFGKVVIVAALGILTSALGFAREATTAFYFGASKEADSFFTAYGIVTFCVLIFSAGALQGTLLPHYQRLTLSSKREVEAASLLKRFGIEFCLVCLGLAVLLAIFAFPIVGVFFNFEPAERELTASIVRSLTPLIPLLCVGCFLQSALHAHHRFLGVALVPVANNIAIISALFFFGVTYGLSSLVGGFLGGAACWILILLPLTSKYFQAKSPTDPARVKIETRQVWINMIPLLLLLALDQASGIAQKIFVSDMKTGTIAALHYGAKVAGVPIGVFAGAISTVFFPRLAQALAAGKSSEAEKWLSIGISVTALITVPASFFLLIESDAAISILMKRGAFDQSASDTTARGLQWFSVALLPQALMIFLNKLFFAAEKFKLASWVGGVNSVLQIVISWFTVKQFGYLGIPIGTSIAAFLYTGSLVYFTHTSLRLKLVGIGLSFAKIACATTVMSLVCILIPDGHSALPSLTVKFICASTTYLGVLWILKEGSLRMLARAR